MDQKNNNPYSTEIPISQAENELRGPSLALPNAPVQTPTASPQPPVPPTSTTPPPPKIRNNKLLNLLPKVIIAVLIILIILLSAYILTAHRSSSNIKNNEAISPTSSPTPTYTPPTPTPTPSVATESANPSSNRFYSEDLGIYFDYAKSLASDPTQTISVQTESSRVYIFTTGSIPTDGQYVDVMTKLTTDSTLQAVSKITLSDADYAGCTFSYKAQTPYPSTYEEIIPSCPGNKNSNTAFFLGDSKHPGQLLFVNAKGDTILSSDDPKTTWQDTLRFL